jgi:predicted AAA+ superfamily ATPase
MIRRATLERRIGVALRHNPVVAIVGPRQCGKTTLARRVGRGQIADYFDLEDPTDLARLATPKAALEGTSGLVVIDEIQRRPELFEILRVLADRRPRRARFLILGSASPHLIRGVSESLAGRVELVEMGGFDIKEVGADRHRELWLRGGFPRSFLAPSEARSLVWRRGYIRMFLERDLPSLGITIPAATLGRFCSMVAHFHGQIWNAAEFARSLGSSEPTARRYLDLLSGAYVIRQLPPWFENISKRQVKSPKIYIRDPGLLHALLDLKTRRDLMRHPKYGASWEGFAVEQVLALSGVDEAYFWATHAGAELDLLIRRGGHRLGFEMKCTDAPAVTKSMHVALAELGLKRLYVVYPGTRSFRLASKIEALAITDLPSVLG